MSDYATGWDEGQGAIWDEVVCSVCGTNHDREESAACDGCEPMPFREWAKSAGDRLAVATDALRGPLEELVAACEAAFAGDLMAEFGADEDVASPPTGITFGQIRRARAALGVVATTGEEKP